jgi:hypothetical protein
MTSIPQARAPGGRYRDDPDGSAPRWLRYRDVLPAGIAMGPGGEFIFGEERR